MLLPEEDYFPHSQNTEDCSPLCLLGTSRSFLIHLACQKLYLPIKSHQHDYLYHFEAIWLLLKNSVTGCSYCFISSFFSALELMHFFTFKFWSAGDSTYICLHPQVWELLGLLITLETFLYLCFISGKRKSAKEETLFSYGGPRMIYFLWSFKLSERMFKITRCSDHLADHYVAAAMPVSWTSLFEIL